jgi:4-amino-4-deoxy-L-arabinose transferase-like glycosyltransferase
MVLTPRNWGASPTFWVICLGILLAGLAVALFSDLGADPPLGPSTYEGQLLLGARARIPGQDIPPSPWVPELLSPLQVRLDAWAFRVFGISVEIARAVSALMALGVVTLLFLLLRGSMGSLAAFLAATLLSANPVFFSAARTAQPSVMSMFLMLVTVWLWTAGARRGLAAFAAGLFLVLAGLVENGITSIFFLMAGGLMAIFVRMHAWKMAWHPHARHRLQLATAGFLFAAIPYFIFVMAHWREFGTMWSHLTRFSLHAAVVNIVYAPAYVATMVRHMPITAAVALGYFLFFAKGAVRPLARHRRLDEIRLWLLAWLLAGVPFFILRGDPNLYALILLAPPLSALAAEGIVRLFALRQFERPKIDVMIVMLLIAGTTWFVLAWLVTRSLGRMSLSGYWAEHALRSALLTVFVSWAVVTCILGWLYLRWKRFTLPLRPLPVTLLAVALTVVMIGLGVGENRLWWRHRTHNVRDASALVEGLSSRALVVGSWAPMVTLGHPARAGVIWAAVSPEDEAWYGEVTHLLLQKGRETDPARPPLRFFLPEGGGPGVRRLPGSATIRGYELEFYEVLGRP